MSRDSTPETSGAGTEQRDICPECGSDDVETGEEEYSFPYGVGEEAVEITARVPIRTCADCGFRFMDQTAERVCHDAICDHLGVMKPSKVKALRDFFQLTQAEFSNITGIGEATLSRWERGVVIQNKAYDNYLYLLGFEKNLQSVRERGESPEPMEQDVKRVERPQFRELDVNDEVLQKKESFKLNPW